MKKGLTPRGSKRANRRAQMQRAKASVRRRFRWVGDDPRLIGIHAKSGRRCGSGCPCCAVDRPVRATQKAKAFKYEEGAT